MLLETIGEEIHEGWNFYPLVDPNTNDTPKYQYYRLKSSSSGAGCTGIGEIRYYGYEVIDDESETYQCAIELVENPGSEETASDLVETVTYDVNSTPVVDDIWPRWGAVSGGTQITFTGRNFNSASTSDYSVTIDDVDCSVDSVTAT